MKKLLIGLAVFAALNAVMLAIAIALPFFISGDVYRAEIITLVERATGRQFRIDGPIKFALLPELTLSAEDVAFANAPDGEAPHMAQLKSIEIKIRPRPLLSGKLEIDGFALVEPEIALEVDKQGEPNWRLGAPAPKAAAAQPPPPPKHKISDLITMLDRFHVAGFEIRDGNASFYDARDGTRWTASGIDVKFAMAGLDSPLTADGNATWKGETVYFDYAIARPGAFEGGAPSHIELHVTSNPVHFDFSGEGVGEPEPKLNGTIVLDVPSLRSFAKWAGIPIAEQGTGLGRFAIKGTLDVTGEVYGFGKAEVDLDAIKGTGGIVYDNSRVRPYVRGSLVLDALDLNPYLGPANAPPAPQAAANDPPAVNKDWSDAPIDLSLLKLADVYFELGTGSIRYRNIAIGESALNLQLKNGLLTASLTKLSLYGGSGQGQVVIDGGSRVPAISESFTLNNVNLELLLRDVDNITVLSGPASLDMVVAGHGKSQRAIASSLTGKGSIHLDKGAIQGVRVLDMVHTATAILTLGLAGGGDRTDFDSFDANFVITDGVLKNTNLKLISSDLPVNGAGTVNLPQKQVAYRLTPKLSGLLAVPVNIVGPWDDLAFQPDYMGSLKSLFGGGGQQQGEQPQ
ncbi:MAG TPA: AsmA family protein [Stellaceae bacterium]|nr:AsmA family protein [Stellaceae bacterium]